MDFNQYNSRRSLLNHECSSVLILHRVLSEKSGHSGTEAILGTQRFSQYRPFKKPCFCADRVAPPATKHKTIFVQGKHFCWN